MSFTSARSRAVTLTASRRSFFDENTAKISKRKSLDEISNKRTSLKSNDGDQILNKLSLSEDNRKYDLFVYGIEAVSIAHLGDPNKRPSSHNQVIYLKYKTIYILLIFRIQYFVIFIASN